MLRICKIYFKYVIFGNICDGLICDGLRNKFLRCRSDENKKAYNEQRNRCVKLVRSAKKAYYSNLSIKDVNDNENFWK